MTTQPKIMTIYGTRPEAIKVAAVIKAFEADERFESIPVITGQHREMLDQVNTMFGITPVEDLNIMRPGQSLNGIVSRAITGLDELLEKHQPDVVIVQGDTSTAMAGGLAAFNRGIKVVHLEAGLRTGNIDSPFPEEANRRLISPIARLHLAPTSASRDNLLREGIDPETIAVAGNTVIDALLEAITWQTQLSDERIQAAVDANKPIILFTTHRRENLGGAMENIGRAIARLATKYTEHTIVLPAHRNPAVREAVLPQIEGFENVIVTEPLAYAEFTALMNAATLVVTDSGGVQEEAPSLGKPVLVMRENTERPEAITAGTVKLIGTDEDRIFSEVELLLDHPAAYEAMANATNPYGDGHAAERTVAAVAQLLGIGERIADFEPEA
ncbi:UDP-N-acetylglucosamine 2-epimerase [Agrococcus casei LMG 22410]|uniref:UDP-N-acetylglucosamine 2-epimerase (non-hydrolyzing) n=2 Tax=Agrococcus TaxID=46352 RepID=A0A1R4FBL7_9MICO|nr:UDP-N-acetylglucosamine 2-epimerase [Agrococcus casei LMG 22410]